MRMRAGRLAVAYGARPGPRAGAISQIPPAGRPALSLWTVGGKYVHPFRVRDWRKVTIPVTALSIWRSLKPEPDLGPDLGLDLGLELEPELEKGEE